MYHSPKTLTFVKDLLMALIIHFIGESLIISGAIFSKKEEDCTTDSLLFRMQYYLAACRLLHLFYWAYLVKEQCIKFSNSKDFSQLLIGKA